MKIPSLQFLLKDTRVRVAIVLTVLWVSSLPVAYTPGHVVFPVLSVLITIGFDLIFAKIKQQPLRFPSSSLVTGLLIGLILEPSLDLFGCLELVLTCLLATLPKHFVRIGNRHIVNPASFGLVAASLFSYPIAWWAVAVSRITIVVIILGMGYILWKIRRLALPVTFLVAYTIYLLSTNVASVFPLLNDGTTFLFAFVMLPEPMTTPANGVWRFSFGPLVVVIMALYGLLRIGFGDPFLNALLTANVVVFNLRRWSLRTSEKELGK